MSVVDKILKHHRSLERRKLPPYDRRGRNTLTNRWAGLGDTMMLTDLPRASALEPGRVLFSHSPSEYFLPLMAFNSFYRPAPDTSDCVDSDDLVKRYDCGNGHVLQRIRLVFELHVEPKPKGCLECAGDRSGKRIIMHFDPGGFSLWQHKYVHPNARRLSPESRDVIEQFIAAHPEIDFIEVGRTFENLRGTSFDTTLDIDSLVRLMASADWFLGITSGPMHIATALGLKCIVLVNFPGASQIVLPTIVPAGLPDEEWLYPQNVHLHQEEDGLLVKKLTVKNLSMAFFDRGIYPFFEDSFLHLIHEKI